MAKSKKELPKPTNRKTVNARNKRIKNNLVVLEKLEKTK